MSETEKGTHRQFKHAFPRCNGAGGGDMDLDSSKLMIGRLVQIFELALKSWKPLLHRIYTSCVRDADFVWEDVETREKLPKAGRFIRTSL